jgi:hypothetical protein
MFFLTFFTKTNHTHTHTHAHIQMGSLKEAVILDITPHEECPLRLTANDA